MKKIVCIVLASVLCLNISCKKTDQDILAEHGDLAKNASVNVSLRKLQEQMKSAKDDAERASISSSIAEIHIRKGTVAEAAAAAHNAVKFRPNLYLARYMLGRSYIELGRFQDAVKELAYSIELKSDFAPSHFELGNAFYKQMNYPGAINEYKKAVALDPQHYMALNNLGVLYSTAGKSAEAVTFFGKTLSIKSDYAPAHRNLGIVYETKVKDPAKAVHHYQEYLKLRPNAQDRALVKTWISLLRG
jgi:tetratricopeptide (TPR) repeat protein